MDTLTAKPQLLKQANLSLIRRILKSRETTTRAEIAAETKISSTTVRTLLTEMMQNGEIESIGYDQSSGGRKAERYRFVPDRYHSAVFCITNNQMYGLLVNLRGEIVKKTKLPVPDENYLQAILPLLDRLLKQKEIKSIGVGVPGTVEGGSYWKKREPDGQLYKIDIGDTLARRFHLPVILENDLNAAAIGLSLRNPQHTNTVYLHFEKDGVSAGLIAEGLVIRGCNHFAGELGLVPMGSDRLLDDCISGSLSDSQYADLVVTIIGWICGILNPRYIALGGPSLRTECMDMIKIKHNAVLPKYLQTELLHSQDIWHDYFVGMAHLTAGKMYDEIQFIKE